MQKVADKTQVVSVTQRRSSGRTLGILSCVFGVLGILTFGILFVPLALLFATFGFFGGLFGRSASGIGFSLLGAFLGVLGFIVSPTLWAAVAAVGITALSISPSKPVDQPIKVIPQPTSMQTSQQPSQLANDDPDQCGADGMGCTPADVQKWMGKGNELANLSSADLSQYAYACAKHPDWKHDCETDPGKILLSIGGVSGPASAQGISGTYVGSGSNAAFLVQVVQTDGGQLAGRYEQVVLEAGELEDTNESLTGAINNGTVVATLKSNDALSDFLSGTTTVSGSFDGQMLHLAGSGGGRTLTLNLLRADESAFRGQVAKLTQEANQIRQAQAEADRQKKVAQAKANQADQLAKELVGLQNLSKKLAAFGPYADKNYSRFDQIEQRYRRITADMRRALAKQNAIIGGGDAYGARSDIAMWINDAQSAASNLHDGVEAAHDNLVSIAKSVASDSKNYDQICATEARLDPTWAAACSTFKDSQATFNARVNSIEHSFQHIALVWGQESEAQKEIIQASNAVR